MTKMMWAAVVHAFGQPLSIEKVPVPQPGPGEVLVRVMACGVCHTDLHAAEGDWPVKPALPFIPGHEAAGVVEALGPGVTTLAVGDRVGVPWLHDACRDCEYCGTGWETLCERQHNTGYSVNGGFAEYVIADAGFAARLPEGVDMVAIAPILCAGVTTYKGLKETEAKPGDWVAISGVGGLGHVAIQYARAMGLRVAALDIAPAKLALAREAGAELAVDASAPEAVAQILDATGGGAQGVLVTAVSRPAFAQALEIVRRRGTVSLVGLPPGDFPTPIFPVVLKRITVRGSIVGTRRDLDDALDFAARGLVRAEVQAAPLSDINLIFDRLRAGGIEGRMVLDLTRPVTPAAAAPELAAKV
ncbi:alcohol dehydrogenase AdhP [Frigidibacter oleivorans]|uniref:alcohol dehydrogenase AdhP n=1 Tax=Frigidibacter oleivorans TaxID=2487129 RepID=UPI000F8C6D03|nr:alcohol dehydrogenase AdhP [Frigidibacter oleivorans]